MAETVVKLEIEEAYSRLKTNLVKGGFKIAYEKHPVSLTAEQGSVWGISPKTAKKKVTSSLSLENDGTHVKFNVALSSDYLAVALAGCIFAAAVMLVCLWISLDLAAVFAGKSESYWSWLVQNNGYLNVNGAQLLAAATGSFAFFSAATLALEILVIIYARSKLWGIVKKIIPEIN